jgi:hypothetical protein
LIHAAVFAVLMILLACAGDNQTAERADTGAVVTRSDSVVIELAGIDSVTVLDLLVSTHQVDHRSSIAGAFVTSIDSVENSSDCFWVYSVNDTMAQVACDKYVTLNDDRVKWHFRRMGQ